MKIQMKISGQCFSPPIFILRQYDKDRVYAVYILFVVYSRLSITKKAYI